MSRKRSIAYHTLGCKLNFSETSTLARQFANADFTQKDFKDTADVYVINTCSVTEHADKECRQLIRRVKRQNPDATVVITGCYAQLQPENIAAIEGVDLVVGTSEKFNIVDHVLRYEKKEQAQICSCDIEEVNLFHASWSLLDRTRTFLKVQDGCDYNCSFCTIPLARGASRSDSIANVLENTKALASSGVKEIVLTGVNLGDFGAGYGKGRQRDENFLSLVQALEEQALIPRYRISSIEPNLLSNEIIDFVAHSLHFMPHFHIPLQSGSDSLLKGMRRRYKTELYRSRVEHIKRLMPHACIGADVITGFPGETDEIFNETLDFIRGLDISYLHVFTYSEREHTHALNLEQVVPVATRRERTQVLRNLSEKKMHYFTESQRGALRPVLFEHENKNGTMEGYSDNYIRVSRPFEEYKVNRIVSELL